MTPGQVIESWKREEELWKEREKSLVSQNERLRDALRCSIDIGARRLLFPGEVLHWEALLAEKP